MKLDHMTNGIAKRSGFLAPTARGSRGDVCPDLVRLRSDGGMTGASRGTTAGSTAGTVAPGLPPSAPPIT